MVTINPALYSPLEAARHEIRVLDLFPCDRSDAAIECRLRVVSLDNNPDFDALSWCWGIDHMSGRLRVNDHDFRCSPNLEIALRHFRSTDSPKTYWVDAVCINQTDLDEKAVQITLMGVVYSQAQTVRAWLGEPEYDSDKAIEVIKQLQRHRRFRGLEILGGPVNDEHIKAFIKLLQRPWWTRIWVVQEVSLAQKAILYCGEASFVFEDFHKILRDITIEKAERVSAIASGDFFVQMENDRLAIEDALFEVLRKSLGPFAWITSRLGATRREPFVALLTMLGLGELNATDLRDKVYGCLGMLPELTSSLQIDYRAPVAQVYTFATFCLIHHLQTLHALCYFQSATMQDLPSWSLRFDRAAECNEDLPRQFRAWAAVGWEPWEHPRLKIADVVRLSVSGSCLDEIVSCHPTQPDWETYFKIRGSFKIPGTQIGTSFSPYIICHRAWRAFFGLEFEQRSHAAYVSGGSMEEAYWRTAAFNLRCINGSASLRMLGRNDVETYLRSIGQDTTLVREYDLSVLAHTARDYSPSIAEGTSYGTSFFKTSRGYIGLALHEVLSGDLVFILDRATLPMVLRPQPQSAVGGETIYAVQSASYVHGVTYGEAFEPPPQPTSKLWERHALRRKLFGGHEFDAALPLKKWDRITLQ